MEEAGGDTIALVAPREAAPEPLGAVGTAARPRCSACRAPEHMPTTSPGLPAAAPRLQAPARAARPSCLALWNGLASGMNPAGRPPCHRDADAAPGARSGWPRPLSARGTRPPSSPAGGARARSPPGVSQGPGTAPPARRRAAPLGAAPEPGRGGPSRHSPCAQKPAGRTRLGRSRRGGPVPAPRLPRSHSLERAVATRKSRRSNATARPDAALGRAGGALCRLFDPRECWHSLKDAG